MFPLASVGIAGRGDAVCRGPKGHRIDYAGDAHAAGVLWIASAIAVAVVGLRAAPLRKAAEDKELVADELVARLVKTAGGL